MGGWIVLGRAFPGQPCFSLSSVPFGELDTSGLPVGRLCILGPACIPLLSVLAGTGWFPFGVLSLAAVLGRRLLVCGRLISSLMFLGPGVPVFPLLAFPSFSLVRFSLPPPPRFPFFLFFLPLSLSLSLSRSPSLLPATVSLPCPFSGGLDR